MIRRVNSKVSLSNNNTYIYIVISVFVLLAIGLILWFTLGNESNNDKEENKEKFGNNKVDYNPFQKNCCNVSLCGNKLRATCPTDIDGIVDSVAFTTSEMENGKDCLDKGNVHNCMGILQCGKCPLFSTYAARRRDGGGNGWRGDLVKFEPKGFCENHDLGIDARPGGNYLNFNNVTENNDNFRSRCGENDKCPTGSKAVKGGCEDTRPLCSTFNMKDDPPRTKIFSCRGNRHCPPGSVSENRKINGCFRTCKNNKEFRFFWEPLCKDVS